MVEALAYLLRQYALDQRRLERRQEHAVAKPRQAVDRVLNQLAHGASRRTLITHDSERELLIAARVFPQQTQGLLRGLAALDRSGVRVSRIIVPHNLSAIQNREMFARLHDPELLGQLIDEAGILDLRRAGLKQKMPIVGQPAVSKIMTLEEYGVALLTAKEALGRNYQLGNLFLLKAVLRARIDLYVAGEKRSAAKRRGEAPGMTPDLRRVKNFLELLIREFPFGEGDEKRAKVVEDLGIALHWLGRLNNPVADSKLVGLFKYLEQTIHEELVERTRLRPRVVKVSYAGRDRWSLGTTGYRETEAWFLQKTKVESHVSTAKLLSMIQHAIDSMDEELALNEQFLTDLRELARILPDNFGRLLAIYETFQNYVALSKDKACAEMGGAVLLVPVGTDQAVGLARQLISMAIRDLELRQEEVTAHRARFTKLKPEVEARLGERLSKLAETISQRLNNPQLLSDPAALETFLTKIEHQLQTLLNGEMREPWLKSIKERLIRLKEMLHEICGEVRRKNELIALVSAMREGYVERQRAIMRERKPYPERTASVRTLREEVIANVSKTLGQINEIDEAQTKRLRRAAGYILQIKLDFFNRDGIVQTRADFIASLMTQLAGFGHLLDSRVQVLSHDGEPIGMALRQDAVAMELDTRPLS
jgi:hypothetical protein